MSLSIGHPGRTPEEPSQWVPHSTLKYPIITSVQSNSFFIVKSSVSSNLASVIFIFAWVAGVVLSPVWNLKLASAIFPPYSYYVLLERVISTYTPDLLNK